MTRSEIAGLVVALLAGGCARVAPPAPRPTAVRPAAGFTAGWDVEIAGESFEVRPVHNVDSASSEVDARYRAWIGATELTDVVWVDVGTLRGRVPAGVSIGRYDLAVEGPFGRGVLLDAFEVIAGSPASLAASIAPLGPAALGAELDIAVTVSNRGEAPVTGVQLEIAASGAGALAVLATAGPQDVPAGETRTFVSRYLATTTGAVALAATATGTDPRTGSAVSATATADLAVEDAPQLALAISIPGGPIALGEFLITATLANVGAAPALAVTVSPPAVTSASTAAAVLVTAPSVDTTLASGQSTTLTWTYRAIASGTLQVQGTVSWSDASGTVRTASATSAFMTIAERAEVIAVDPLGDGSPFAFVAGYRGALAVGPNRTGTVLALSQLDGTGLEHLAFAFERDVTGNVASNTAAPYASVGFTGCTANSATNACGPDNEDGRGLLTSVSFAGDEWLLLGGARSAGELDYVYLSRASTSPLTFSYVDVGSLLGAATRGFTSAAVSGDRLYLGFADNGGNRPYALALLAAPAAGALGLDAIQGTQGLELGLHNAYNALYPNALTTISMIDAIGELSGRVYLFNNTGCLAATSATPATSNDFFACSPTAGIDYDLGEAVAPTQQSDLEPHHRAWPQVASWNGRLFAIHNTTTGPQLWCCEPWRRGDPLVCDPSDWYLVAPDGGYRTRLGETTATAATLLVATPTHLFLGFDDPVAGIHVFRTSVAAPVVASDFTGHGGCRAGTPACEGLGGDGVGAPMTLKRIFDAKAIAVPGGGTDLYLTAGDGASPVSVVRMSP